MPAALTYLAIMLAVIIIWFLLLKRPVYEAVLISFILLLTITGTWGKVGGYINTGLKTSLLYFVRDRIAEDPDFMEKNKEDICASFQKTLIDILMDKLIKAARQTGIKDIAIGGGVSANSGLRQRVEAEGRKRGWRTFLPEFKFTTDNAAMIAIAGYYHYLSGERTSLDVAPVSRLSEF